MKVDFNQYLKETAEEAKSFPKQEPFDFGQLLDEQEEKALKKARLEKKSQQ